MLHDLARIFEQLAPRRPAVAVAVGGALKRARKRVAERAAQRRLSLNAQLRRFCPFVGAGEEGNAVEFLGLAHPFGCSRDRSERIVERSNGDGRLPIAQLAGTQIDVAGQAAAVTGVGQKQRMRAFLLDTLEPDVDLLVENALGGVGTALAERWQNKNFIHAVGVGALHAFRHLAAVPGKADDDEIAGSRARDQPVHRRLGLAAGDLLLDQHGEIAHPALAQGLLEIAGIGNCSAQVLVARIVIGADDERANDALPGRGKLRPCVRRRQQDQRAREERGPPPGSLCSPTSPLQGEVHREFVAPHAPALNPDAIPHGG